MSYIPLNINNENYKISSSIKEDGRIELEVRIIDPQRSDPNAGSDFGGFATIATYTLFRNNKIQSTYKPYTGFQSVFKTSFILNTPGSYHLFISYFIYVRKGFWPFYFGSHHKEKKLTTKRFSINTEWIIPFLKNHLM